MSPDDPGNIQSSNAGFWWSECNGSAKRGLMVLLVACFVTQTALVYLDPVDSPPLSALAQEGRQLWQRHNCQTCHQIYGFGGFLGPDLTNAADRVAPERLHRLLAEGTGSMPAFDFTTAEATALSAFLEAMNETGQGQVKRAVGEFSTVTLGIRQVNELREVFAQPGNENIQTGFQLFMRRGCLGCHIPLGEGLTKAPDILTTASRLTRSQIMTVLEYGVAPTMPSPGFTPQELEAVYDLIVWLGDNRYALAKRSWEFVYRDEQAELSVPWWEYAP